LCGCGEKGRERGGEGFYPLSRYEKARRKGGPQSFLRRVLSGRGKKKKKKKRIEKGEKGKIPAEYLKEKKKKKRKSSFIHTALIGGGADVTGKRRKKKGYWRKGKKGRGGRGSSFGRFWANDWTRGGKKASADEIAGKEKSPFCATKRAISDTEKRKADLGHRKGKEKEKGGKDDRSSNSDCRIFLF